VSGSERPTRKALAGKDERRAVSLRHVAQRLKRGSSKVTSITPVKRVIQVGRQRRRPK
jgi:hypothetical protein